jgi:hypothetical protein
MKKSTLFLILFMLIFSLSACANPFNAVLKQTDNDQLGANNLNQNTDVLTNDARLTADLPLYEQKAGGWLKMWQQINPEVKLSAFKFKSAENVDFTSEIRPNSSWTARNDFYAYSPDKNYYVDDSTNVKLIGYDESAQKLKLEAEADDEEDTYNSIGLGKISDHTYKQLGVCFSSCKFQQIIWLTNDKFAVLARTVNIIDYTTAGDPARGWLPTIYEFDIAKGLKSIYYGPQINDDQLGLLTAPKSAIASAPVKNLEVEWLAKPIQSEPDTLAIPYYALQYYSGNDFMAYNVGKIKTAPFSGDYLYIIKQSAEGPGGYSLYHMISDKELGFVVLNRISDSLEYNSRGVFIETDVYTVKSLEYPQELTVKYNNKDIQLVATYSPPEFLADYKNKGPYGSDYKREIRELLTDPLYGRIYEDLNSGVLIAELPDKLIKLYTLKMPFERTEYTTAHGFTPETYKVAVKLSDKWTWTGYFTPLTDSKCQIPVQYQIFRDIGDKLKIGGKIVPDLDYYVPKDANDGYLMNSISMTDEQKTNIGDSPAVFFYKDELGRYIRFAWSELYWGGESECFW